jgi:hypothetical protein
VVAAVVLDVEADRPMARPTRTASGRHCHQADAAKTSRE